MASNRIIADRDKYLDDAMPSTTVLDLPRCRRVLVQFEGKSYRVKRTTGCLAKDKDSK